VVITVPLTRQIAGPPPKFEKKSCENPSKSLIQRVIKKAKHLKHEKQKNKTRIEFCSNS